MASPNANGLINSMFKTSGEKYSCSLKEKPTGSLSLINPDIIKRIPTKIRITPISFFNVFFI